VRSSAVRLALAIGVLVVGISIVAQPRAAVAASPFTDIGTSAFKADIEWLYSEGITSGCTSTQFCPTASVTRGQVASFLSRMFDLPSTSTDFFVDDESSIHEGAINRLAASGITSGCTSTQFCPNAAVTRDQMASFITKAADLTTGAGRNYFYDDNNNTHEASIDRAAAGGIVTGCATWRYCPTRVVTREQMAGFLHRVVEPITSPPYPAPAPPTPSPKPTPKPTPKPNCDASYPDFCIPPPPPDLDCPDVAHEDFTVREPDPHRFDGDNDGVGCES